ncbi:MAG: hypothetical protein ACR2PG_05490 [Hyphomicrobiaceae bacterium]
MQAGTETLRQIEHALANLQDEEHRLHDSLGANNATRSNLLELRLADIKRLAQARIRHAIADGIVDRVDNLSATVRDALQARQKTITTLQERQATAEKNRRRIVSDHDRVGHEIYDLEERFDALANQARASLAEETSFQTEVDSLKTVAAMLTRAQKKADQAEQDRDIKGRAYRNDPLFMYLWDRKFGQKDYQSKGVIRLLDELVARFVRYHDARANFTVLNQIPERLNEHVKRIIAQHRDQQELVEKIVSEAVKTLAGSDLEEELRLARDRQLQVNQTLAKLTAELAETVNQLNTYAAGRDRSFARAIDLSAGFLESKSLEQLTALARSTPEPADDEIVDNIRTIDRQIADGRLEGQHLGVKLEEISRRREELLHVAANFRRNYYDDPGSIFVPSRDEYELEDVLGDLLGGIITGADYWHRARRQHRWTNRPADPYRRSSGLPPWDGGFDNHYDSDFNFDFDSDFGRDEEFRTGGGF